MPAAQDSWFENYRIESQNENQIGLQMEVANLTKALQSAVSAQEVLVKLAKKGVPVLTFEITTALGVIMQDVPVYVLTPAHLAGCVEPETPAEPGVVLPPLAKMFHVVDRMRTLGTTLQLHVVIQSSAVLTLRVTAGGEVSCHFPGHDGAGHYPGVAIKTTYQGLYRATMESESTASETLPRVEAAVAVDVKHFSRALFGHTIAPEHAFCFVFSSFVLVHLPAEGATLSYFVRCVTMVGWGCVQRRGGGRARGQAPPGTPHTTALPVGGAAPKERQVGPPAGNSFWPRRGLWCPHVRVSFVGFASPLSNHRSLRQVPTVQERQ